MTEAINPSVARVWAERIKRKDPWLVDYILGWACFKESPPWGAATSFALEVAHGYEVIVGESDATLTELGQAVAKALKEDPS